MTTETFEADDLTIRLTVNFTPGSEITSLIGAAVEARMRAAGGTVIPATSCAVTSATTLTATFADGLLSVGVYTLQIRATVSGVTQTIAEKVVNVRASIQRQRITAIADARWSDGGAWEDSGAWRD